MIAILKEEKRIHKMTVMSNVYLFWFRISYMTWLKKYTTGLDITFTKYLPRWYWLQIDKSQMLNEHSNMKYEIYQWVFNCIIQIEKELNTD